jgi:hypothetical protein
VIHHQEGQRCRPQDMLHPLVCGAPRRSQTPQALLQVVLSPERPWLEPGASPAIPSPFHHLVLIQLWYPACQTTGVGRAGATRVDPVACRISMDQKG